MGFGRHADANWLFRALHVLWALAGIYASVVLLRAGGHPPGLAYLPVAVVAWALGHLFLWGAGRLALGVALLWGPRAVRSL